MKVRVGFGLGGSVGLDRVSFTTVVDELECIGFDSLWVSERANSPTLDPMVAMTWAAARTERLKVGTSVMVLPGRNPVLLAKAIATLDVLSDGRALPAFVSASPTRWSTRRSESIVANGRRGSTRPSR